MKKITIAVALATVLTLPMPAAAASQDTQGPSAEVAAAAEQRSERRRHRKRVLVRAYQRRAKTKSNRPWGWSIRTLRRELLELRLRARYTRVKLPAILHRIARCESHGNPRAISSGGHYRGKYQFSFSTWRTVGGKGDPARASEAEQDYRALKLYRREGASPWPVCGR